MRSRTFSSAETKLLGKKFAQFILRDKKSAHATVVAFTGDLGSGKTTFIQGLLRGLGVKGTVPSPTFVLMRHYRLRGEKLSDAYHIDAYRMKDSLMDHTLLRAAWDDPKNLVLIEWAERVKKILPKHTLWLKFLHGRNETERVHHLPKGTKI
jgi:tRNA threonylcarbamoyladenosine biosynthesis protein TsaE